MVAAWTGVPDVERCIQALLPQLDPARDELIVAHNFPFVYPAASAGHASVHCLFADAATVPQLRSVGFAASSGELVAFVEDHVACSRGWATAVIAGFAERVDGVGGPVDLGPGGKPLDWAAYFYDYSRVIPPKIDGRVRSLSGANMSWRRAFLDEQSIATRGEVLESALVAVSLERGIGMWLAGDAIVVHRRQDTLAHTLRLAFSLARSYAAERGASWPTSRRAVFAIGTAVLPALLLVRILAAGLRSGRHAGRLVLALPWLLLLTAAWAVGEGAGYLLGGGRAGENWK